jgi:dTDP-glucose 4,6-dehydratase
MARAFLKTYGLPVVQSNCSNNYGPRQFPEKLIPLMIRKALTGKPLPLYGDGLNIRDWIHVADHCCALDTLLLCARPGSRYLIGGDAEMTNLQVVHAILQAVREAAPDRAPSPDAEVIEFVRDRPGHDRRYAVDATAIRRDFGWRPLKDFATGLRETVRWYLDHEDWCNHIEKSRYSGQRLGTNSP